VFVESDTHQCSTDFIVSNYYLCLGFDMSGSCLVPVLVFRSLLCISLFHLTRVLGYSLIMQYDILETLIKYLLMCLVIGMERWRV
jgi:ethanolamine transporter EutH